MKWQNPGFVAWMVLLLAVRGRSIAHGVPKVEAVATARAAAYQVAARSQSDRRGWTITHDRVDGLVAEHYTGIGPGAGNQPVTLYEHTGTVVGVAKLTVAFQPLTSTNTGCSAKLVQYLYSQKCDASENTP